MNASSKLDAFEGRSAFRTWAVTNAVRTAVSKMRPRDGQNVSLNSWRSTRSLTHIAVDAFVTGDQTERRRLVFDAGGR